MIIELSGYSDDLLHVELRGYSDDLLHTRSYANDHEYNMYDKHEHIGYITLTNGIRKTKIKVLYDGAWSFAPAPVDDDVEMVPLHNVEITQLHQYSVLFSFEVADSTQVRVYTNNGEDITDNG